MNDENQATVQNIEDIPVLAYVADQENISTVRNVINSIHDMLVKKEIIEINVIRQTLEKCINAFRNDNLRRIVQYFSGSIPDIIIREPDDSLKMYLDAIKSLIVGNGYSAKARIGRALHLDPNFLAARQLFQIGFPNSRPGDSADSWAEGVTDLDELAQKQVAAAVSSFNSRQFEAADRHMQLYNSLRIVDLWPPSDLATCRALMASLVFDGNYDDAIDNLAVEKRNIYATNWPVRANEIIKQYVASVDDSTISRIAKLAIEVAPNQRFLDFGAYVCIVPMAIRKRIGGGLFHAVEPDAQAVAYVRENLDFVTIHHGSHEEMIAGRFDIPNVDVVIAHRVLGIMHPKEVARVFAFLAGKTRRILISDDVLNFDGDRTVIRIGVSRFAHNYGRMLTAAGFRSHMLKLPARVERYITGIIIAER